MIFSSDWDEGTCVAVKNNPDPHNFTIEKMVIIGAFVVVKVKYPDCTNCEGLKIMIYEKGDMDKVENMRKMDPHFSLKGPSPLARFMPTDNGWAAALKFTDMLSKEGGA